MTGVQTCALPIWQVEMGVLAYDNLSLNELDIVGEEGSEMALSGGPSPDPSIGR